MIIFIRACLIANYKFFLLTVQEESKQYKTIIRAF